jgi:hypothetical protein
MAGQPETNVKSGAGFIEAIKAVSLKAGTFPRTINAEQRGGQIVIQDDTLNDGAGGERIGQVFLRMPEQLSAILPGSVLMAGELMAEMVKTPGDVGISEVARLAAIMTGTETGTAGPLISLEEETGTGRKFNLNVYHGSFNKHALTMTLLASQGFDSPVVRGLYQDQVFQEMEPILKRENGDTLRIVEDCVASADTIEGFLSEVGSPDGLLKLDTSNIRIDVASATAQGILLLRKFAKDNNLNLELNVGHVAYGLSEGVPSKVENSNARVHANYLVYPEGVLDNDRIYLKAREALSGLPYDLMLSVLGISHEQVADIDNFDGLIRSVIGKLEYVVGDMGDAAKGISSDDLRRLDPSVGARVNSWNSLRKDPHGEHNPALRAERPFDPQLRTVVCFANGGHLMEAMLEAVLKKRQLDDRRNVLVVTGKRAWTSANHGSGGYGVVIGGIPQDLIAA